MKNQNIIEKVYNLSLPREINIQEVELLGDIISIKCRKKHNACVTTIKLAYSADDSDAVLIRIDKRTISEWSEEAIVTSKFNTESEARSFLINADLNPDDYIFEKEESLFTVQRKVIWVVAIDDEGCICVLREEEVADHTVTFESESKAEAIDFANESSSENDFYDIYISE